MTEKTRIYGPHDWHKGLFAGNGKQGLIVYGEADGEILVYQHMDLVLPTREPRFTPPEVRGQLEEARQSVLRFDDEWDIHHRNRTFLYPFHPALQLHAVREDAPERRGPLISFPALKRIFRTSFPMSSQSSRLVLNFALAFLHCSIFKVLPAASATAYLEYYSHN